ncbi:hypothetical protein QUC_0530 [Clostridioides difficile P50]|nr:hypothetical protein QKQ_0490 [Clostridioides difficile DA00196]EQI53497.1 hypothetical protein QQ5_0430 [Clostridioides difficile Y270]EQJ94558.1 hypothetical protein QUC_0530 [Clostridioides difficile P50]
MVRISAEGLKNKAHVFPEKVQKNCVNKAAYIEYLSCYLSLLE